MFTAERRAKESQIREPRDSHLVEHPSRGGQQSQALDLEEIKIEPRAWLDLEKLKGVREGQLPYPHSNL